ncbi:ankyrin repeat protein [Trichoderma asperelloides]|nr:ankyrin repeat protein [Trichoderma asperelloides]
MSYTRLSGAPAPSGVDEKKRLSHDAYTVGWICVLQSELNAAKALLDEQHEQLPSAKKDDNSYLLGSMAGHNVAIAFTGSGNYGTNAAAQTAVQMIRTFHNIRFGLMVGVGGGAPNRPDPDDPLNDLRLGDVVVSVAKGSHDQVALKASKIRGLKQYKFPGRDKDQLFISGYTHATASDCSACDPTQAEERLSRESDEPMVHYGLIASGNAVIRSAKRRDELRDAWGVLCFEMEAAGLMDDFPCIVIRGICDYSDDHKNKVWQPYSAVAAAAYAKDLLRVIQPQEVESMEAITAIIGKLLEDSATTREVVTRIESKITVKEDNEILKWLSPVKYGLQQSDFFHRRQPGTGQWLLDSVEFQGWLKASQQTLFCQGIPGAGKTILTSIVVNDLYEKFGQDSTVGIAFIYCNFQRTSDQQVNSLLMSLLRQLSERRPSLPSIIQDLYNSNASKHTRPSLEEIRGALQSVAQTYSRIFLIIDALDECQASGNNRKKFLTEIFTLRDTTKANVFVTSRYVQDIRDEFNGSILLDIRAKNDDIRLYLGERMSELPSFVLKHSELQERIIAQIANAIDGMFLLAKLHLDLLQDKLTPKAIIKALDNLPKGDEALNQTYDETMRRIQDQGPGFQRLALQALSWISCSMKQLSTIELQTALAVEKDSHEIDKDNIAEIKDLVSACAGLVIVDERSNIVRLVHYTTQEYFQRTQRDWFPDAQNEITSACLTYITFDTFSQGVCSTYESFKDRIQSNPLYSYAAQNWGHHARNSVGLDWNANILLESQSKMEAAWQVYEIKTMGRMSFEASRVTGLHLTAFFGLQYLTSQLLSKYEPDVLTRFMETPLMLAAKSGHEAIVKMLLENGAHVEAKDAEYRSTPIYWEALSKLEGFAELPLATRLRLEPNDKKYGQTPLMWAARNGHEAIVKLLIQNGSNLEFKDDGYGWTPLIWAARNGHEAIVKLLLESGADFQFKDSGSGKKPLKHAMENGHEAVVNLLLQNTVDLNRATKKSYKAHTKLFAKIKRLEKN